MINKLFFLFSSCVVLISCNEKPLTIQAKSLSQDQIDSCQSIQCPEIQIDYVVYAGREQVSDSINKRITNFIIETLYLGDPVENPNATSAQEAATHFVKMYWTHHAEFPDLTIDYFADILVAEKVRTKKFISLSLSREMYTGGAHGYRSITYYNVDTQTGKEIAITELFSDSNKVLQIAERYIRAQHNIALEASINSTGFWFKNDTFHLPETIGFTTEVVVFHYNPYEVASYAEGPIIVEIPIEELKRYMNYPILAN